MSHDHWCPLGKHYIRDCRCKDELPVNKVCAPCVARADQAKTDAVQQALEEILDKDPSKAVT